jgi:SpoVK/Ycf46/Vps4 family AAA+-type ATPase
MTLADDVNLEEFVMTKDELSGADIKAICTEAGLLALRERRMKVNYASILYMIFCWLLADDIFFPPYCPRDICFSRLEYCCLLRSLIALIYTIISSFHL